MIGLNGKIARQTFNYFDATTLAPGTQTHTSGAISGYAAWLPNRNLPLLIASVAHEWRYVAAPTKAQCPTGVSSGPTCVNGPIGLPTRQDTNKLSFEARQSWGSIAVSANVTRDFQAKVTSVEAPIYFISDGHGGLNGGVKLGWRSDTRDIRVGVFFTKSFNPYPL